ncbi:ABC transporter permease [Arthrobacter pigmenti]
MTAVASSASSQPVTGKGQKRRTRTGPPRPLLGLAGIIGFLLIWEALPRLGVVNPDFLPPASEVLVVFVQNLGLTAFWVAVGQTLISWGLGLAVATIAALALGLIIGSNNFLRKATHSTIEFLRPIPSVALIPLAVLIFGVDRGSALMLVIYASFWQVLIQVLYGVADVDTVANDTAKSYGLGAIARIRYVVWPTTLPYFMTGLRLAAAVALILAITAELIIGNPGLGHQIALAQSGAAVSAMYALILATGLLGVLINLAMRLVERRTLAWHSSIRGEAIV